MAESGLQPKRPASAVGQLVRSDRIASRLLLSVSLLAGYGLLFALLRHWSSYWATFDAFSLWFPAAGLRFALLWWAGARWAPAAALAELLGGLLTGTVSLSPSPLLTIPGVVGPCLVYGLIIHLVRSSFRPRAAVGAFDPLPFGAAAIIGPIFACLVALTWALPRINPSAFADAPAFFETLLVFVLGDLLGIVLLAPPLLALAHVATSGERLRLSVPSIATWLEIAGVFTLAWMLVWFMRYLHYGVVLAPVLLATCWAGLRGGRSAALTCVLASASLILPMSGQGADDIQRIHAHMLLTCIAAGGYLIGSYVDAQALAAAEIRRRDRLLLHAERLKTLRAMSLSVIHDVSQPLSTIALEASSLLAATGSPKPDLGEVRDMAERISRKSGDLSELVRRLRRFGDSGSEERSMVTTQAILSDILGLLEPEAASTGVKLVASAAPERIICVSEVEIRQALLNLGRNAIKASPTPGAAVSLSCEEEGGDIVFCFENQIGAQPSRPQGMRMGLFIARAIARAHGGTIKFDISQEGRVRCSLKLPVQPKGPRR